jgi:beta-N-acetylhexosaminidase
LALKISAIPQLVCAAFFWIVGLLLLAAGANLYDPYLVPFREWGWLAILAAALMGLAVLWRLKNCSSRKLLLALWFAVPIALASAQGLFEWRKAQVLMATRGEAARLGSHFITGYWRLEDIAPLAEKGLIGGIFVTGHNIEGRSAEALGDEIAYLQSLRRAAGLPPLIVATDQEGGIVAHLSPPLTRFPSLSNLADLPPAEQTQEARLQGERQGRELAALGITADFAPVVDLKRQMPANPLDFNSHIGQRAISSDPTVVASVALAFAQGLAAAGVQATVKHFPGLGRVGEDTHHFSAHLDTPLAELANSDWQPFRTVLAGSNSMLMIGHVALDAVDPDRPASHSKRVVQDLIRKQWAFDGLIVTDDLVMGAIYHHGFCTTIVEALNGGVDLLLIAFDGSQYYGAMACALAALREGQIDPSMLALSEERMKAAAKDRPGALAPTGTASH